MVLNKRGFYKWTFSNNKFSVYLLGWLGRILRYLDFDTWMVPLVFCSDQRHLVVITRNDAEGGPSEIEITCSHTMARHSQASMWSTISKYFFSEPVHAL